MPDFLGDTVVVTKDELVPKFWRTYNSLKMELYRHQDKPYGIKRAMLGGNGRKLLVDFDTLPKRIQDAIGDPRKPDHLMEEFYRVEKETVDFYNDFEYPDGKHLVPDTIEKNIVNASVLKALVKLEEARKAERISKGGSLRGIGDTLFEDAHSFNDVLRKKHETEHSLNKSVRRFKEQLNAFKDHGHIALVKDAEGKSKRNAMLRNEKTNQLLDNLFAGRAHKPNPTEVAREYKAFLDGYIEIINEESGELYDPKDFKELKPSTITSYLRSWESRIGTHAKRSGDRQQLLQKYVPYESMERPELAGSIISIDDRQPPFWYEKGKRMWWYIGIDLASECIVAWAYGKTKEELILNFYKNVVVNHHNWNVQLPFELECESSLNSSFKNTFLRNGAMFEKVNIHANSARSKRIERFFRDIRYEMEKAQVGWLARPFPKSEANQAGPGKEVIIPYEKLVQQCIGNIITWNNMPKKGTEVSRFDYFMKNQDTRLRPTNYKSFLKYLGTKTETSCNAGIMKLQKGEWLLGGNSEIYTGEKLINLLKQVEGRDIDIYWMEDNNGKVFKALVYDMADGRYICEALPKPISARAANETQEHHRRARMLMARYRNTVTTYMRTRKNAIDKLTVIDNRPKTVSNSFTIEGFESFTPNDKPAEVLDSCEEEEYEYVPQEKVANGLHRAFYN
jgi:hypothetical protein